MSHSLQAQTRAPSGVVHGHPVCPYVRRHGRSSLALALLAATSLTMGAAYAAQYCVGSVTELRNAINAVSGATGAGSNDIRIRSGLYNVATGASGTYALNLTLNTTPLSMSGGWNSGCTQRLPGGSETYVHGNQAVRVLSVLALAKSGAELTLDGLTLGDARASSGDLATCLRIETDVGADVNISIDRVGFVGCRADTGGTGPALEVISRSGTVRVRSSLIADNASPLGAVFLRSLGGSIHFNGNTVAYNDDAGAAGGPVGVQISQPTTGGSLWLNNNILWGNGGAGASDLFVGLNAVVFMNSNLVGSTAGDLEDVVQLNGLSGNPGFVSPTSVVLSAASMARNSGLASPVGGNTTLDFDGRPRVQGQRIDRGALEFGELFANGFE